MFIDAETKKLANGFDWFDAGSIVTTLLHRSLIALTGFEGL